MNVLKTAFSSWLISFFRSSPNKKQKPMFAISRQHIFNLEQRYRILFWNDHLDSGCRYIFVYIYNLHWLSCQKEESRFSMLPIPCNGTCLAVSQWKLRMVLMVGYRSSRLNQNKPFSGPVSTVLSSSAEFYSFSLSGRLRAVGLIALTMCHNSLYTIN